MVIRSSKLISNPGDETTTLNLTILKLSRKTKNVANDTHMGVKFNAMNTLKKCKIYLAKLPVFQILSPCYNDMYWAFVFTSLDVSTRDQIKEKCDCKDGELVVLMYFMLCLKN